MLLVLTHYKAGFLASFQLLASACCKHYVANQMEESTVANETRDRENEQRAERRRREQGRQGRTFVGEFRPVRRASLRFDARTSAPAPRVPTP